MPEKPARCKPSGRRSASCRQAPTVFRLLFRRHLRASCDGPAEMSMDRRRHDRRPVRSPSVDVSDNIEPKLIERIGGGTGYRSWPRRPLLCSLTPLRERDRIRKRRGLGVERFCFAVHLQETQPWVSGEAMLYGFRKRLHHGVGEDDDTSKSEQRRKFRRGKAHLLQANAEHVDAHHERRHKIAGAQRTGEQDPGAPSQS